DPISLSKQAPPPYIAELLRRARRLVGGSRQGRHADAPLEPVDQLGVEATTRTGSSIGKRPPQLLRHSQEEPVCLPWQSRATINGLGRDIKRDIAGLLPLYGATAVPASTRPA